MEFDRERTACFSGHRSYKGTSEGIIPALTEALREAVAQGYTTFVSGACEGFDLTAAECVLQLKQEQPHIKLVLAIPFPTQADRWASEAREQYLRVLCESDSHVVLSESYRTGVYHERNKYMVDSSSLLICYYNGSSGGTRYTVELARREGLRVVNLFKTTLCVLRRIMDALRGF